MIWFSNHHLSWYTMASEARSERKMLLFVRRVSLAFFKPRYKRLGSMSAHPTPSTCTPAPQSPHNAFLTSHNNISQSFPECWRGGDEWSCVQVDDVAFRLASCGWAAGRMISFFDRLCYAAVAQPTAPATPTNTYMRHKRRKGRAVGRGPGIGQVAARTSKMPQTTI